MKTESRNPQFAGRIHLGGFRLAASVVLMLLPLVVGLLSVVVQLVLHVYLWNIRQVRENAFPLFLATPPLFLVVAIISTWRSASRGGQWMLGTGIAILLGMGLVACSWFVVLIGGFAMK